MFDTLRHQLRRLKKRGRDVCSFASLGASLVDRARLGVVGYAHEPEFGRENALVSRWLRRRYPRIRVKPQMLRGSAVTLETIDWTQVEIFREIFILGVYDLQRVPFTPDLILDCGGHIGFFTTLACTRYPQAKVMVFEPNPRNIDLLTLQIIDNRLPAELVPAAVSDSDRQQWFTVPASSGGRLSHDGNGDGERFQVRVIDLVRLLDDLKPGKLLLKMDIEGEEVNLLPKLIPILPKQSAVFFETHDGQASWQMLQQLLAQAGFTVTLLRERDPYRDGLAVRN